MPSALVLGSHGFIGRNLVKRLDADGWAVTTHVRGITEGDLRDEQETARVFASAPDVEYVFHAADVLHDFMSNAQMTINVLAAWHEVCPKARLIGFTSLWAYPARSGCFVEAQYDDGAPAVPDYAAAKKLLGAGIEEFKREYGMHGTMLTLGNVYGPDDRSARVIPSLVATARRGASFEVRDADARRNFTYIDDAIDGIVACRDYDGPLLNVVGLGDVVGRAARLIAGLVGRGRPTVFAAGGVDRLVDGALAAQRCGWHPRIDLPEGLRLTIEGRPAA